MPKSQAAKESEKRRRQRLAEAKRKETEARRAAQALAKQEAAAAKKAQAPPVAVRPVRGRARAAKEAEGEPQNDGTPRRTRPVRVGPPKCKAQGCFRKGFMRARAASLALASKNLAGFLGLKADKVAEIQAQQRKRGRPSRAMIAEAEAARLEKETAAEELLRTKAEAVSLRAELITSRAEVEATQRTLETSRAEAARLRESVGALEGEAERLERCTDEELAARIADTTVVLERVRAMQLERSERRSRGSRCLVCQDAPANTCLVPCGHVCACLPCTKSIQGQCPVCHTAVVQVVRTQVAT